MKTLVASLLAAGLLASGFWVGGPAQAQVVEPAPGCQVGIDCLAKSLSVNGGTLNGNALAVNGSAFINNAMQVSSGQRIGWSASTYLDDNGANGQLRISNNNSSNNFTITAAGSGSALFGGSVTAAQSSQINWAGRSVLTSPADATVRIANNAGSSTTDLIVTGASTTGTSTLTLGGPLSVSASACIGGSCSDGNAVSLIRQSGSLLNVRTGGNGSYASLAAANVLVGLSIQNGTTTGVCGQTQSAAHYSFTGTTATWTLATVAAGQNVVCYIKNRGAGTLTINSNSGGNDIYSTSAVNTYALTAGSAVLLVSDGTYYNLE